MNRKIWIAAFACVCFVATAQSSSTSKKASAPRENGSGQASGQAAPKAGQTHDRESSQPSVSEGVVRDTGNMAGNHKDGWNAVTSTNAKGKPGSVSSSDGSTSQWPSKVATGDVNGDGHADVAASAAKGASTNGQTSREISSGMPTGRRQHDPLTVTKTQDAASPKQ